MESIQKINYVELMGIIAEPFIKIVPCRVFGVGGSAKLLEEGGSYPVIQRREKNPQASKL